VINIPVFNGSRGSEVQVNPACHAAGRSEPLNSYYTAQENDFIGASRDTWDCALTRPGPAPTQKHFLENFILFEK